MKRASLIVAGGLLLVSTQLMAAKPASKEKAGGTGISEAKRLFERYVALEKAFDPAAADLYSDDAVIQNRRKYPDGNVKTMSLPAPKYKALIRSAMPAAKARNDSNSYSDIRYVPEGAGVRITAQRFSELKKYTSPLSLLVKPDAKGTWLIYEELSESQP
jgi:hypothetical protein